MIGLLAFDSTTERGVSIVGKSESIWNEMSHLPGLSKKVLVFALDSIGMLLLESVRWEVSVLEQEQEQEAALI